MRRVRGFTLIELMIVVAIIAILAGLAIAAYSGSMRKSRRAEAKHAIADMAIKEEKYRASQTTYGTCNQVAGTDPASTTACASYNATLSYYTINVTANTAIRVTITATPKGSQANDSCGTFTFDNNAGTITKTPTGCW